MKLNDSARGSRYRYLKRKAFELDADTPQHWIALPLSPGISHSPVAVPGPRAANPTPKRLQTPPEAPPPPPYPRAKTPPWYLPCSAAAPGPPVPTAEPACPSAACACAPAGASHSGSPNAGPRACVTVLRPIWGPRPPASLCELELARRRRGLREAQTSASAQVQAPAAPADAGGGMQSASWAGGGRIGGPEGTTARLVGVGAGSWEATKNEQGEVEVEVEEGDLGEDEGEDMDIESPSEADLTEDETVVEEASGPAVSEADATDELDGVEGKWHRLPHVQPGAEDLQWGERLDKEDGDEAGVEVATQLDRGPEPEPEPEPIASKSKRRKLARKFPKATADRGFVWKCPIARCPNTRLMHRSGLVDHMNQVHAAAGQHGTILVGANARRVLTNEDKTPDQRFMPALLAALHGTAASASASDSAPLPYG